VDVEDLVFRSRALAQTHPHSRLADRFARRTVEIEIDRQPSEEIGHWAGYALTTGYCFRKVEEAVNDQQPDLTATELGHDAIDAATTELTKSIRADGLGDRYLFDEAVVVDTLDHLIAGEIDRRLDQWSDQLDPDTWRALEDYLAWWVIKGYALRVYETSDPAGAP
jgi:hypothetical protein